MSLIAGSRTGSKVQIQTRSSWCRSHHRDCRHLHRICDTALCDALRGTLHSWRPETDLDCAAIMQVLQTHRSGAQTKMGRWRPKSTCPTQTSMGSTHITGEGGLQAVLYSRCLPKGKRRKEESSNNGWRSSQSRSCAAWCWSDVTEGYLMSYCLPAQHHRGVRACRRHRAGFQGRCSSEQRACALLKCSWKACMSMSGTIARYNITSHERDHACRDHRCIPSQACMASHGNRQGCDRGGPAGGPARACQSWACCCGAARSGQWGCAS